MTPKKNDFKIGFETKEGNSITFSYNSKEKLFYDVRNYFPSIMDGKAQKQIVK